MTLGATVYNLLDKDFTRLTTWTNSAGETAFGSPYSKPTSGTKGSALSGRTFWLTANVTF